MFGSDNSIEPVHGFAAGPETADGKYVRALSANGGYIREATPADRPEYIRPVRRDDPADQALVQAAAAAKGGFFRRHAAEPVKPDAVAQQHGLYTADKHGTRRYYADYQQKREVMWAGAKSIKSKLDDKQTVSAMLDLAQSRGWNTVRLKGTQDFQREAWVQAQVRGMAAEGYKPAATDQQEAARRTAAVAPVKAASGQAAESKPAASAGASRDTVKVTNTVTSAVPAEKRENSTVKASEAGQAKPAAAAKRTAAAPVPAVSAKAAPAVQAPTAATSDSAAAPKVKANPVQRKSVWDAVEATGKQARAADAATAKATAGERPSSAATA